MQLRKFLIGNPVAPRCSLAENTFVSAALAKKPESKRLVPILGFAIGGGNQQKLVTAGSGIRFSLSSAEN